MRVQIKEIEKHHKIMIRSDGEEKVFGYWARF